MDITEIEAKETEQEERSQHFALAEFTLDTIRDKFKKDKYAEAIIQALTSTEKVTRSFRKMEKFRNRTQIMSIRDKWKRGYIAEDLFRLFNVSLDTSYPVDLMRAITCLHDKDEKVFLIRFSAKKTNSDSIQLALII